MLTVASEKLIELQPEEGLWERTFMVAPLVLIGTREPDGSSDLAPKHMAMPVSWRPHFGFVCTPSHGSYANVVRTGEFSVSYPRPDQVVISSLAATPRCDGGGKPLISQLPTIAADRIDAPLLAGGHLYLECRLNRIVDDLGPNSLIIGDVIAARAPESALVRTEQSVNETLHACPLLAYIHPGRYAEIADNAAFPLPRGFER